MKRWLTDQGKVLTVIGLSLVIVAFFYAVPAEAEDQVGEHQEGMVDPEGETSVVAVSGDGELKVEPNVAYLTLGVETLSEDPRAAQEENSETIQKVVAGIEGLGVDSDDIRAGHYRINQRHHRPEDQEEPEYQVTNMLEITVRDLDDVGRVLETSVDSGVNSISSVQFGVLDEADYKLEALEKALENAEQKGERIADFYGKSLGEARQISEKGTSLTMMEMDYRVDQVEEAEAMGAGGRDAMPADPDKISFTAKVDVMYEIN